MSSDPQETPKAWLEITAFNYIIALGKGKTIMKFDFCIGNPPYQEDTQNEGDRPNPVYNDFMDAAYAVADVVELITPARFLFDAGQTPKAWNKKMLSDGHLKVIKYEPDATKVFPTTEIKGGVAITIRDSGKQYGAIHTFTVYESLNDIVKKVGSDKGDFIGLDSIIASQGLYRFSTHFMSEHQEILKMMGKGTGNKITSKIMETANDVFVDKPIKAEVFVKLLGRINNSREYRYIERKYLEENPYIDTYNVFLPEANSNGKFGETLTEPTVGNPGEGAADTYLSAGIFKTVVEANNFLKYFKTKFFRAMLGVKKVTHHCPPSVWKMIPLQDFTDNSDINWNLPIPKIDQQLYKKYGLSKEETAFIEENVKEME